MIKTVYVCDKCGKRVEFNRNEVYRFGEKELSGWVEVDDNGHYLCQTCGAAYNEALIDMRAKLDELAGIR